MRALYFVLFLSLAMVLSTKRAYSQNPKSVNEFLQNSNNGTSANYPTAPVIEQPQSLKSNLPQGLVRKPQGFESTRFPARIIYLNGNNVSSVRNQTLENVTIRIDENGNVHITAPQYEVATDSSYHPLLPSELPRFPKHRIEIEGMPQGTYSKNPVAPQSQDAMTPQKPIAENEAPPPLPSATPEATPSPVPVP